MTRIWLLAPALAGLAVGVSAAEPAPWYGDLPSITALRQAAASQPSLKPAAFSWPWSRQLSLDDLWKQADVAFHAGHYWDLRRIYFKIVDLDPTDLNGLDDLAFSLAMLKHSDADAQIGKDLVVVFQPSDFDDLGGLSNPGLLAIATDASSDGFAKGRAVYAWDQARMVGDWEFFNEYALHLALEQGHYLLVHKLAGGLALVRQGFQQFDAADALLRGSSESGAPALLGQTLLTQADLHMTLVRKGWSDSPADDQAQAVRQYQDILALPEVPADATVTTLGNARPAAPLLQYAKTRAQVHLKELGATATAASPARN